MSYRDMLQRVLDERAQVWEQAKALNDTVLSEDRDYTADEKEKDARLDARMDELDAKITDYQKRMDRERRADEARAALDHDPRPPADDRRNGGPSERDTFEKLVRGEIRAADFGMESRDLTAGTATDGPELIAEGFYPQLVEHMIESSAIRQTNVTVLTTDGGNDLPVPKTTSYSSASIVTEAGSISESDPQFSQVTLQAYKYGFLLQVSTELIQDQSISDFVGFLARQGGRALGNGSGTHFVTGDGSAKPNGVVTAATVGYTSTTTGVSGVPQDDDVIETFHSVIPEYRRNAYWLMSDATAKGIRKLQDSNGQYIWQPGLQAGQPDVLLGRPIVVDTNVADAATSAKSMVFGDFSGYFIRDVRGVRIERSDEYAFGNDLVTWRFLLRTDGDLVDTNAVKTFQAAAS